MAGSGFLLLAISVAVQFQPKPMVELKRPVARKRFAFGSETEIKSAIPAMGAIAEELAGTNILSAQLAME
ncbi:hypothetical protein BKX96_07710 [Pseudomonas putida]|nr:hypothetical protein BKX96_07710 [Pseudomonas putida]